MVKKKKAPAIFTSDEDLGPFGFKIQDIVRTPLGITGTVLGVKYESPEAKETGRVWVRYENGHEAPLELKLATGYLTSLGYHRCPQADHIRRDVDEHVQRQKALDVHRKIIEEICRCKELGIPIPEHLLPKAKKAKPKSGKGKDKKKK